MRGFLVSICTLMVLSASVSAQNVTGLTGKGVKLGINMSELTEDAKNYASKLKQGFGGGVFITYHFTEIVAIQPEILYFMKGTKFDYDPPDRGADTRWDISYIEIPVLLKITPSLSEKARLHFSAGPAISFLLSAKIKSDLDTMDGLDLKESTETVDMGIALGVGIDYDFNAVTMGLDIRYTKGISDVLMDQGVYLNLSDSPESMNNNISILLGIGF